MITCCACIILNYYNGGEKNQIPRQQAIIRSSSILKINWKNWKVNWIITFNFKLHCILKETHALNSEKKIECTYYTISVRTCLNCDYRKWQFYTFKRFTTSSRRRRRRTVAEFKSHFSFTCFLRIASWLLIKFMVLKWILIKHAHQLASELVVSL